MSTISPDPIEELARELGREFDVIESPNYGDRRGPGAGRSPTDVLLHYTACEKERTIQLFQKPNNVASHYLVDRQGNMTRFVDESKRAWHAGAGAWHGNTDVNSTSIGIETINLGFKQYPDQPPGGQHVDGDPNEWYPYDEELLGTLAPLCQNIIERYDMKPNNVIGHSDMATFRDSGSLGRKVDPGPLFPWECFYRQYGIGAWYNSNDSLECIDFPHQGQTEWVRENLVNYGYPHPGTWNDANTTQAVKTFQMHFRQKNISGVIDHETVQILTSLVDRYIERDA